LLDLWKNFKKIEFQASIDHVQERAEYIRHGTDWAVVENNLSLLVNLPNLNFSVNTVLSIFNYLTLDKFYTYMIDRGLIRKYHHVSLYRLTTPHFLCVQNLPRSLKDLGRQTNSNLSAELQGNQYEFYNIVQDAIAFTELLHPNEIFPTHYKKEIQQKDKLRNENIETTFPELRELKIYD
jgi:sulfatase maturation enzyme AslB (radical SAM superfamily)